MIFFLSFPDLYYHTQRNEEQSFVFIHEILCEITQKFSWRDINKTHCINSSVLNRAERYLSHFEKAPVAFYFTNTCRFLWHLKPLLLWRAWTWIFISCPTFQFANARDFTVLSYGGKPNIILETLQCNCLDVYGACDKPPSHWNSKDLDISEKYHKCFKYRQLPLEQNLWAAMKVLSGSWAREVGFIFTYSC